MKKISAAICALFVASCASHSPITPDGRGGFFVSKQAATGFPGVGNLESELYQQAGQFCQSQGKAFRTVQVNKTQPPYVLGNYPRIELAFACD